MRCLAHRGFAAVNPENTVEAVRAASDAADVVEVDVRRCGTGEVVVCHDATVDRVTDGHGRVADHALAALQALSVLGTHEGIPAFTAVLDALPAGVGLNVELKERGLAADVLRACVARDRTPLVSSFDAEALREAAAAGAERRALLVGDDVGAGLATARELGCEALHPAADLVSAGVVARARDADLTVNAWTVRDDATADRLAALGVDGLIADAPAYCR